jgi:hypothetical protein
VEAIAEGATTLGEIGGPSKAIYEEYEHYLTNAEAFESGEANMSAVIDGSFDTYHSKQVPPAVVGTALGITVKSTRVPTISLSVSRSAYSWPGQSNRPFSGPLPSANQTGSKLTPYTGNPFSGNAPTIMSDPFYLNIGSGTGGLANLNAATHQLPAVNQAIQEGGIYQNLTAEENSAPERSCPTDNDEGLVLSPSAYAAGTSTSTICWLFKDGDA